MNKKAALGAQTMIYVFLLSLVIIGGGIAFGIGMFFSAEYDFRAMDASALTEQIASCLKRESIEFPQREIHQEFYKKCRINQEIINKEMFISIKFNNKEQITAGRGDATQCALAEKNNEYPRCVSRSMTKDGNKITILAGSNQKSRKIAT